MPGHRLRLKSNTGCVSLEQRSLLWFNRRVFARVSSPSNTRATSASNTLPTFNPFHPSSRIWIMPPPIDTPMRPFGLARLQGAPHLPRRRLLRIRSASTISNCWDPTAITSPGPNVSGCLVVVLKWRPAPGFEIGRHSQKTVSVQEYVNLGNWVQQTQNVNVCPELTSRSWTLARRFLAAIIPVQLLGVTTVLQLLRESIELLFFRTGRKREERRNMPFSLKQSVELDAAS